jgi:hypothetical protein
MWLKITEMTVDPTEIHYLFSLEDSARCYISIRRSLICDTANRDQLEIQSPLIYSGKWIHLVLSV